MDNKTKKLACKALVLILLDAVMMFLSGLIAFYARFHSGWIPLEGQHIPTLTSHLLLLLWIIPLWIVMFALYGLYNTRTIAWGFSEYTKVINAATLGTMFVMIVSYMVKFLIPARGWVLTLWILSIGAIITARISSQQIIANRCKKRGDFKRILIAGADKEAHYIAEQLSKSFYAGAIVVGLAGEDEKKEEDVLKPPVLGKIKDIPNLIKERGIDTLIIVSSAFPSHNEIMDLLDDIDELKIDIQLSPGIFEIHTSRVDVQGIGGIPLLHLRNIKLAGLNYLIKSIFDYIVASLILIITSPLLALIALLIKLTSPGPVMFAQERASYNGRPFKMYKFRTMKVGAEDEEGPVWAKKDDPRRTKLGAFLRRHSLDEFPQLFNILKGNMSLVGPRPERPCFIEEFQQTIPRYMKRLRVKSGITGWAQVNNLRGDTPLDERIKYDNFYIENWSFGMDLKILFLTIFRVFRDPNAY
ncbi:MAG TPA: undecaprenyl-phosphate glucose phosphotransferase [Actinobacteria bacterium]|nr:undecaprenyl-phosphate glucose phosphotransferase [Actinomycetota bacterium]